MNIQRTGKPKRSAIEILEELLLAVQEQNFKQLVRSHYELKIKQLSELIELAGCKPKELIDMIMRREDLEKELKTLKMTNKLQVVIVIRYVLNLAKELNWGICKYQQFYYLFNGQFWTMCEKSDLQYFFGKVAEKMGIIWRAKYHGFQKDLFLQFVCDANLPKPIEDTSSTLINLQNGTYEISMYARKLRPFSRNDFLTYQLPFEYDPNARAVEFFKFLNKVLPDINSQSILAEYIGYLFIKSNALKLEKALFLYGTGANGKSVCFDIIGALLGSENVSNYSLQSLTDTNGYSRAMLANKLVNYASEMSGKQDTNILKQLISGEPVEARLPYNDPFIMTNYAKLLFNSNELPKNIEHTHAFFRRLIIIGFSVTIPEKDQDKELAKKIIDTELSGVFNWVIEGLERLLKQKAFTTSEVANNLLQDYKKESDNVQTFLEDENYLPSASEYLRLKEFYASYRCYCQESGFCSFNVKTVSQRLKNASIRIDRKNYGMVVYVKKMFPDASPSSPASPGVI